LTLLHLPILYYYLWKRAEIKFFDNDDTAREKSWIRNLIDKGAISRIPCRLGTAYDEDYLGDALDKVDNAYGALSKGSILIRAIVKLYEDDGIELSYKKELARILTEFCYVDRCLKQEEADLEDHEQLLFIPYDYRMCQKLLQQETTFGHHHPKIDISRSLWFLNCWSDFVNKAKARFIQVGLAILYSANLVVSRRGNMRASEFEYAIPVTIPYFQFKFEIRSVDFLLDGNRIRNDNTLFILMEPGLSAENLEYVEAKNLRLLDCSGRFVRQFGFDWRGRIRLLRKILSLTYKTMFCGWFEYRLVDEVNLRLFNVFLKWSFILQVARFKHYIELTETGVGYIGRNILLQQSGVQTWAYTHSVSTDLVFGPQDSNKANRHCDWSYNYCNDLVLWNDEMVKYYKLHPQHIDRYYSIGCIWSEAVSDVLNQTQVTNIKKEMFPGFESKKYKCLACFDSTYLPNDILPLESGIAFYQGILNLLQQFPDTVAVVKEKKSEEKVLQLYADAFGGDPAIFWQQYKPVLDELRNHPRCHVTGYKGDPSEIIAISDLTITLAFSSSTVEALGARKRGIYYDPLNRWNGMYYDQIPDFVAHDYETLQYLVRRLLYETSEDEYKTFLDTHIKGMIDPYLDGKAVTRFRKLLSE